MNHENQEYLVLRKENQKDTIIDVNGVKFGGDNPVVIMAGPCAVESYEQIEEIARYVSSLGIRVLRGGIFKPRTSPYDFQGLGKEGLTYFKKIKEKYNLVIVSEVMDIASIDEMLPYVDILQVGTRNMQNFNLLKVLGKINKPILLKRGLSATLDEWLLAAEYILKEGNSQVILCERGIRTFEPSTRNTLDLSSAILAKRLSHLPVVVDPSHGSGRYDLVEPLSFAAIASGADGLLIEVHNHPEIALSDGYQSIRYDRLANIIDKGSKIANVFNRELK